jgi:hypothetical protein
MRVLSFLAGPLFRDAYDPKARPAKPPRTPSCNGRLRGLKPSTPGNSACRSFDNRSTIFPPQSSRSNRLLRSRPIDQ